LTLQQFEAAAEEKPSVLIVDDDPEHLRIYGWIMKAAGLEPVAAQVTVDGVSLPAEGSFSVIVLDYRLTGSITAVEAAQHIRRRFPAPPIIVLSDLFGMPADIAAYARCFVRKGEPEKLIQTIRHLLAESPAEPGTGV
jgi:two-component system response regulator GlrR